MVEQISNAKFEFDFNIYTVLLFFPSSSQSVSQSDYSWTLFRTRTNSVYISPSVVVTAALLNVRHRHVIITSRRSHVTDSLEEYSDLT